MESTQLCYDCAFKHISCAQIAWAEVNNGYRQADHIAKVMGNLSLAEEHLLERHKDLAENIREGRKDWWDALIQGAIYRPPFEEWLQRIWELTLADFHSSETDLAMAGDREETAEDG